MAYRRNGGRGLMENFNPGYREIFDRRGEKTLTHFTSPHVPAPTNEFLETLRIETFTWHSNYKMWKLAADEYGDPSYWWVIAWFNNKPTDAHFSLGDVVYVPFPLEKVLSFYGVA